MKGTRSRKQRKLKKKTPGGKLVIHYKKRKTKKLKCSICKKPLHGIPNLTKSDFDRLPKTQKRPQRPYGGVLCSKCAKKKIIEEKCLK